MASVYGDNGSLNAINHVVLVVENANNECLGGSFQEVASLFTRRVQSVVAAMSTAKTNSLDEAAMVWNWQCGPCYRYCW